MYINTVPSLFSYAIYFINNILVPVIFAVAFLMFLVGVYRYFIASQGNPEKVGEGQKFVMWSLVGFFIMFSIWGLVNLLINTLGFGGANMPRIPGFNGTTDSSSYGSSNYGSSDYSNYGQGTSAASAPSTGGGTSAASAPKDGSVGPGGSCQGNENACDVGYICSDQYACVSIPANGTVYQNGSCLGNVNACRDGLTCATQTSDTCQPSSNSGASNTYTCPGTGVQVDNASQC